MKQILAVRSNDYYEGKTETGEFKLVPSLELIIIYTDGKSYKIGKGNSILSQPSLVETRMIVSPELLQSLITDLQLHQKKLENIRHNSDQINSLIKHIQEKQNPNLP